MLAQTTTASFEGIQTQVLVVIVPLAIATLTGILLMVKSWVEWKTATFKAAALKAEAEAATALAEAEAAKANAERSKKVVETIVKGVESIKDEKIKDVTKTAVKAFSEVVGQFENVDKMIVDLGLAKKRSKSEVKSPTE